MLEYYNIKTFLEKAMFQIGLKTFLSLKQLKTLCRGHISDLKGEEIVGTFYEKELQETNKKDFSAEKIMKRKGDKLYVKRRDYDNSFNS